jgi:hypothetical protein
VQGAACELQIQGVSPADVMTTVDLGLVHTQYAKHSAQLKNSQGDESWPAVSFSASDGKRSKKMYVITYKTAIRWIFRSVFASLTIFSINSLRIHILTRGSKLPAFTIDFVVLRTAGSSNTF